MSSLSSTAADRLSPDDARAAFGDQLEFDTPLAPLTSYKTGGPARLFLRVTSAEEIVAAIATARRLEIPFFLVGGGSNLLVSDDGFDGIVIKIDVRGLTVTDDTHIEVGAGEDLMDLVRFAARNSLAGIEFLAGIWGSVGGAIYGNAGAFGCEIGSVVESVTIITPEGTVRTVDPEYCRFGYRDSYLKESKDVIVSARLRLEAGKREALEAKIDEITTTRDAKHPNTGCSAGCFFKNIPDERQPHGKLPAGKLLDEAGAKDLVVGGAKVFDKHANIIVNTGTATSSDIRRLADLMKAKVKATFGIELQEEVQQVGKF